MANNLFIPTKEKAGADNRNITIAFRAVERWADNQAGVQEITSTDGSVTVTNPFGPVVNLHVATGGGGGYASLTGPGFTTTPGDLTQAGGFTVNAGTSMGIALNSTTGITGTATNGISFTGQGSFGVQITSGVSGSGSTGGMTLTDYSNTGISINAAGPSVSGSGRLDLLSQHSTVRIVGNAGVTVASQLGNGITIAAGIGTTAPFSTVLDLLSYGQIQLGYGNSTPANVAISNGQTGASVQMNVLAGSPNAAGLTGNKGDVCFDTSTPGIWVLTTAPSTWTMYTLP